MDGTTGQSVTATITIQRETTTGAVIGDEDGETPSGLPTLTSVPAPKSG